MLKNKLLGKAAGIRKPSREQVRDSLGASMSAQSRALVAQSARHHPNVSKRRIV